MFYHVRLTGRHAKHAGCHVLCWEANACEMLFYYVMLRDKHGKCYFIWDIHAQCNVLWSHAQRHACKWLFEAMLCHIHIRGYVLSYSLNIIYMMVCYKLACSLCRLSIMCDDGIPRSTYRLDIISLSDAKVMANNDNVCNEDWG